MSGPSIAEASRSAKVFSHHQAATGHVPSFTDCAVPPGWAVCLRCGRPIDVAQLCLDPCGAEERVA